MVYLICTPSALGPAALVPRGVHIRQTTSVHVTNTKCILVYTGVYLCILMYTGVYLCILMYTLVYLCILIYTHVYCCVPMHTRCLLVYTGRIPVYTGCIAVCTCVYWCIPTYVYWCIHIRVYLYTGIHVRYQGNAVLNHAISHCSIPNGLINMVPSHYRFHMKFIVSHSS